MFLIFKMHVLAYLLSISASLETGLNFLKTNTTLLNSSLELNTFPKQNLTFETRDNENIKSELSKSTFLTNHSRDELLVTPLRKTQDLGIERDKNRTRKQKEITNATKATSVMKRKGNNIVPSSKFSNLKKSEHREKLSETSTKIKKQQIDKTYSNLPNVQPSVFSKTLRRHSNATRRPLAPITTQTTKLPIHEEIKSTNKISKKDNSEGRYKNRPQRNRHKRPSISDRRPYRIRFPSRLGPNEKDTPDIKQTSKEVKRGNISTPRNSSLTNKVLDTDERHNKSSNKDSDSEKKDCPTCGRKGLSEDIVRQIRLDMFIKTMADKLRVTPKELMARPNRRTSPRFPRELLEETLQDNAMQRRSDQFFAKDQQTILSGQDLGRNCIAKRTSGCYSFDLAGNVKGEVATAELWVYKTPDRNDTSVQTFLLYGLERLRSGRVLAQNQIQRHDSYVREGWVVINITRTVTSWVQGRKTKEMIAIRCATCVTRKHKALYGTKHGYKPLIIIKYDKTSLESRGRRSYDDCNPEYDCCRRNLDVNFHEIKMFSIEAPPDLSVGYCYGKCNGIQDYTHNHTMIKQKIRFQGDDTTEELREQLEPCCVPISFRPALLMIRTSTAGTITSMPNAIVNECGCV